MKRIALKASAVSRYTTMQAVPACREMHLSDQVSDVLADILGIPMKGTKEGMCSPAHVLRGLGKDMNPHKSSMSAVGLPDSEFLDLVSTMRALSKYAVATGALITYEHVVPVSLSQLSDVIEKTVLC